MADELDEARSDAGTDSMEQVCLSASLQTFVVTLMFCASRAVSSRCRGARRAAATISRSALHAATVRRTGEYNCVSMCVRVCVRARAVRIGGGIAPDSRTPTQILKSQKSEDLEEQLEDLRQHSQQLDECMETLV